MSISSELGDLVDAVLNISAIAGATGATGAAGGTGATGAAGSGVSTLAHGKVASNGTLAAGSNGVSSVSQTGTGQYLVTLNPAMANTNYKVLCTGDAADGQNPRYTVNSASQFEVSAFNNTAFSFLVIP